MVKERQARRYMKLASEMPQLLDESKRSSSTVLGIDAALTYLAAPEEVKAEVDNRIEAGESVTQKEIAELKRLAEAAERKADAEAKEAEELADRGRRRSWGWLRNACGQIIRYCPP